MAKDTVDPGQAVQPERARVVPTCLLCGKAVDFENYKHSMCDYFLSEEGGNDNDWAGSPYDYDV